MSMLGEIVLGLALGLVPWVGVNITGWWSGHRRTGQPWNWRVLVWPDVYYRWLDRRTNGDFDPAWRT